MRENKVFWDPSQGFLYEGLLCVWSTWGPLVFEKYLISVFSFVCEMQVSRFFWVGYDGPQYREDHMLLWAIVLYLLARKI